ncbi:MAG: DNA polymerase III subunit delta' C-terminal domain-containing protein [Staphylococcus equorum]|uniref:DNA polymerase III subunit delta' C-terminal domain-containing protein n=1 Tax=Staphylococcus TaxID=1279 RepID=UPI000281FB80|nr:MULTISPECIES: DNA polymerase III subunit delta' C-terminal domain-containing protein [Staphylococcus]EJX16554.1 DNA polymerase III delta' subunit [Staphylococcus sp. OJ82]MCM3073671.1 DNA polymerase III subunit delta' [Staphylococcus equorum]MDG0826312.1 DNA polymerase III subunit delta' [Staphylococcus equorum]MDK9844640.1 DNA polymerase III subunit delta' C-terminal domain-containing protein [Staphylococcus equorum]MDK9853220.1 DNA polymerase III subunit delta' C-terminal domain-containin
MDERERLTKAYQSNKLSHAYLFEGDDGQTMQQVAIDFTKLILCDQDNQCQLKVETFNHPDFMYISSEENTIKKDQIEQLLHHMNQLPIEGDYKVYIIESFEKLTIQGENSILKFLEEPPENTIAILLTTKPEQILDTIHSRCQHVYFKPINKANFINRLVERDISRPVAELLSTYTTQIETAVTLNEEADLMALRKSVIKWCQLLLTNRPMALIAIVDLLKQAKNRRLQMVTLAAVNGFFQDVMHAKVGMTDDMIYQDLQVDVQEYTKKLTYNQIILMYDQITEAHKKLNQNVNPTLVFEQIVIKGVN